MKIFNDLPSLVAEIKRCAQPGLIRIRYRSVDGLTKTGRFTTLADAQRYAQECVGETPVIGTDYAVSADGVGTVRVSGVPVRDLFPTAQTPPAPAAVPRLQPTALGRPMRGSGGFGIVGGTLRPPPKKPDQS